MSALLFLGSAIPVGLFLGVFIANLVNGWKPFRQHHAKDAYWCTYWSWFRVGDLARPCYHETPEGPRCCNCGLKPPKEHGAKLNSRLSDIEE